MFSPMQLALMANQQDLEHYTHELEDEIKRLQRLVNQKDAQVAGLTAQVLALKAECPKSGLLKKTGEVYRTKPYEGRPKSYLTKVYEKAHDDAARKMGITNPEAIRAN